MPRKPKPQTTQATQGAIQYRQLKGKLGLLAWLDSLFGYPEHRMLLEQCKQIPEGYDADEHSPLCKFLATRIHDYGGEWLSVEKLMEYDTNIYNHLNNINKFRNPKITLRYFQYLAALFTEIVLDGIFNDKDKLLEQLNTFVSQSNDPLLNFVFSESDLNKLAFWMSTGSGKTILLHINYHQFLHYNQKQHLDNILLITPNEGLSVQHIDELSRSNISAVLLKDLDGRSYDFSGAIKVVEITKLTEEKRGSGASIPIESFSGRNLVLVDEGHKGAGGDAWRNCRNSLAENGFTFEYSATFGQALSAAKNDDLLDEYGKSIVFDYSYKYFYGDGFGKDFRILNLQSMNDAQDVDILLLGNLLSFYEQLKVYEEKRQEILNYNLEKPLWVFVGSTVNAVYIEKKQARSDVLTVIRFLNRVLRDASWAIQAIKNVLNGQTGLVYMDAHGLERDVFFGKFDFLKKDKASPQEIYDDILQRVFHTSSSGGLHIAVMQSTAGELALKAVGADEYFGLIYIGDAPAFRKLLAENNDLEVSTDAITNASLFSKINNPDSKIHVLLGAKKFIEGWNSWRVSCMGLLNIGQQEGSQIIQFFGRGVRLKGKEMSLKRSAALQGTHPGHIQILETLNIFAVRANYMAQFRDYLEREGISTDAVVEMPFAVDVRHDFLQKGLLIPRVPDGCDFTEETSFCLQPDAISVQADFSVKVQAMESRALGISNAQARSGRAHALSQEILELVDWQQVYLDIVNYKITKRMTNLVIRPDVPKQIVAHRNDKGEPICTVVGDERLVNPKSLEDRAFIQRCVTRLLCMYIDKYYRRYKEKWHTQSMQFLQLDETDPNFNFQSGCYIVKIPQAERQLIEAVEKLLAEQKALYQQEDARLPRIYFDRHLYQPLLVALPNLAGKSRIEIAPPGLNEHENKFVADLREFWRENPLKDKEIFLLRNLSRGHGVGFFQEQGFYPDFILWILDTRTQAQRIIFVEPHGMIHAPDYENDEKAKLWERLHALNKAFHNRQPPVSLDSFIVSATPYDQLRCRYGNGQWTRHEFAGKHILFPVREMTYDYIRRLFTNEG